MAPCWLILQLTNDKCRKQDDLRTPDASASIIDGFNTHPSSKSVLIEGAVADDVGDMIACAKYWMAFLSGIVMERSRCSSLDA